MDQTRTERAYQAITGASDQAKAAPRPDEARNGVLHIAALSQSKLADGLIDPKLVLSWLLTALGTPAWIIGLLVPIREAGALLPQVILAGVVQRMRQRRWLWVMGSVGQGIAAAAIALFAATLSGAAAGWAICAALAVLAVSRAASSVSYKDILGKTVPQTRRGAVTGLAGSVASAGVFVFAVLMILGVLQSRSALIGAVALAAVLWLGGAITLSRLSEEDSDTGGPSDAKGFWAILREDANLRQFILVRGLLVSTALAPPYLVVLAGQAGGSGLERLGAMVLASSAAAFLSSYIWGRLADQSGRLVLALAGAAGTLAMGAAIGASHLDMAAHPWVMPAILFGLMVAYHGVRQSRSTYLVDMSPDDARAAYAALANTVIGLILLAAGALGGVLGSVGAETALWGYAAMAGLGGALALRLDRL